jgi:glycosyltransferase involved in cell wall biosynthesis
MRALELCLSPDLGGLELYMYRSAVALQQAGDTVMSVTCDGAALNGYIERAAIPNRRLNTALRAMPLLAARRLARLIDEEAIEVIHAHWAKDLPLAALAKRFSRRKPRLVFTRQMQITRAKTDPFHNFIYRQIDRIITITESLAEATRGFLLPEFRAKVLPLYYGVKAPEHFLDAEERRALRAELGLPQEGFVVALFGRVKKFKGQHLLLDAMAQLLGAGVEVNALIVGRAMEKGYLAEQQRRAGLPPLAGHVHFRDFMENPQRPMQACDCVLLASEEETFGLVLAEAMRAGVAVIGSDRGGVPEIIDHGKTGLLFRSGDSADLAEQLRRYIEEPALKEANAAAGKADADRRFDEADHFERLRQLLARP